MLGFGSLLPFFPFFLTVEGYSKEIYIWQSFLYDLVLEFAFFLFPQIFLKWPGLKLLLFRALAEEKEKAKQRKCSFCFWFGLQCEILSSRERQA